MSSACLILIESRIELTDGSINTRSCSDRVIVNAVRRTSDDVLQVHGQKGEDGELDGLEVSASERWTGDGPCLDLGNIVSLNNLVQ
jgi:hypothetical protein